MYDVVIIGAGAAGLAASRTLHDAGLNIIILEAQNRIGGRIHTDSTLPDCPIELGAEFLHGENVATHGLLHKYGFSTTPAPRYQFMWWAWDNIALPCSSLPEKARMTLDALDVAYENIATAQEFFDVDDKKSDLSLANYLRQKGFNEDDIAYADTYLSQTCCASIESISAADLAREMRVDRTGEEEYRVKGGYSAFFQQYSADLPIRLAEPVEHIHRTDYFTVKTGKSTYKAKTILVTVSVSVLKRGLIDFYPQLSTKKRQAIQSMKMESATKLIYQFDKPYWSKDMIYLLQRGQTPRWWTNGNLIYCFLTAERAEHIDSLSESDALSLGLSELSVMLNQPNLADFCIASRRKSWANDVYIGGGYAHVPVGFAHARVTLSEAEDDIFFAGEATAHESNPQTVHGALESGWRAAKEILETLRFKSSSSGRYHVHVHDLTLGM